MTRTFIAVTIGSALALGTLGVFAHEAGGPGHGPGGMLRMKGNPLEHLTKDLDLTPDQQAKVSPIVDQAKPQIKAIHEEAMQKAKAVMDTCAAQIRPLLTPPQQAKFDEIRKEHEETLNTMREKHQAKEE